MPALLLLAGCGQAGSAPSATLAERPADRPTIVSLNPCTDAMLAEIAGPQQVLALSHYSRDPAARSMPANLARRYGVTGGTVEEVLALDPDVVVAGAFLAPSARAAFADFGIRVETFGIASSVEQSLGQIERLGDIAGNQAAARRSTGRVERAVAQLKDGAGTNAVSTVLWQSGGIVPGEATLVSDLLRRGGFASHSQALGLGQADFLPLERVLSDPPDLLLVAGAERAQHHPALAEVANLRVETIDPALLFCGGPTIARLAARLQDLQQ